MATVVFKRPIQDIATTTNHHHYLNSNNNNNNNNNNNSTNSLSIFLTTKHQEQSSNENNNNNDNDNDKNINKNDDTMTATTTRSSTGSTRSSISSSFSSSRSNISSASSMSMSMSMSTKHFKNEIPFLTWDSIQLLLDNEEDNRETYNNNSNNQNRLRRRRSSLLLSTSIVSHSKGRIISNNDDDDDGDNNNDSLLYYHIKQNHHHSQVCLSFQEVEIISHLYHPIHHPFQVYGQGNDFLVVDAWEETLRQRIVRLKKSTQNNTTTAKSKSKTTSTKNKSSSTTRTRTAFISLQYVLKEIALPLIQILKYIHTPKQQQHYQHQKQDEYQLPPPSYCSISYNILSMDSVAFLSNHHHHHQQQQQMVLIDFSRSTIIRTKSSSSSSTTKLRRNSIKSSPMLQTLPRKKIKVAKIIDMVGNIHETTITSSSTPDTTSTTGISSHSNNTTNSSISTANSIDNSTHNYNYNYNNNNNPNDEDEAYDVYCWGGLIRDVMVFLKVLPLSSFKEKHSNTNNNNNDNNNDNNILGITTLLDACCHVQPSKRPTLLQIQTQLLEWTTTATTTWMVTTKGTLPISRASTNATKLQQIIEIPSGAIETNTMLTTTTTNNNNTNGRWWKQYYEKIKQPTIRKGQGKNTDHHPSSIGSNNKNDIVLKSQGKNEMVSNKGTMTTPTPDVINLQKDHDTNHGGDHSGNNNHFNFKHYRQDNIIINNDREQPQPQQEMEDVLSRTDDETYSSGELLLNVPKSGHQV